MPVLERENKLTRIAAGTEAALKDTNPSVVHGVIYQNTLAADFLAVLHNDQIAPPFPWRSVRVMFNACCIAADLEGQSNDRVLPTKLDLVGTLSLLEAQVGTESKDGINHRTQEDEEKTGVNDVDRQP